MTQQLIDEASALIDVLYEARLDLIPRQGHSTIARHELRRINSLLKRAQYRYHRRVTDWWEAEEDRRAHEAALVAADQAAMLDMPAPVQEPLEDETPPAVYGEPAYYEDLPW